MGSFYKRKAVGLMLKMIRKDRSLTIDLHGDSLNSIRYMDELVEQGRAVSARINNGDGTSFQYTFPNTKKEMDSWHPKKIIRYQKTV